MTTDPIANLLSLADAEGARFWPHAGSVHYRSPAPLSPHLRALVVAHKPALLVALARWDAAEATRLMNAADGAVEASGADGRAYDAVVLVSAGLAAYGVQNMAGVREACARLEEWARKNGRAT